MFRDEEEYRICESPTAAPNDVFVCVCGIKNNFAQKFHVCFYYGDRNLKLIFVRVCSFILPPFVSIPIPSATVRSDRVFFSRDPVKFVEN